MDILSQGANTLRDIAAQASDQEQGLSHFLQRLSSGQRISSPSDDAAGSALATKSETESRLYTSAIRNISDGISAVNVASSALDQLSNLTARMEELAKSATSATLSTAQRTALDEEAQQLRSEFERITASTDFNGANLIDGSVTSIAIQAGITSRGNYAVDFGTEAAAVDFQVTVTEDVYDGTFSSATTLAGGTQRNDIESGDFNGDGYADLVTIGSGASAQVRLGNGDGTFGSATSYAIAPLVGSIFGSDIEVGDFDGDGISDLVAASYGSVEAQLSFLKGNGDGTFQAAVSSTTVSMVLGFALVKGDFDEDGDLDVIVTDGFTYETSIALNDGSGNFGEPTSITGGYGYGSPSVADFNNDGNLDFVGGNGGGTVAVLKGDGDGTFQAAVNLTGSGFIYSTAVGDVDGDGDIDIVASNGVSSSVGVFLNNGDATFAARVDYATGDSIRELELRDLTGDGVLDIVGAGGTSIYTLVGSGTGTFGTAKSVASNSSMGTVLADFDGDGVRDIASVSYGSGINIHLSSPSQQTTTGDFSLLTVERAIGALTMFSAVNDSLTLNKGKLAAGMSRLEVSLSNAEAMRTNLDSAVSAIRDIDVATEMSGYIRTKVLLDASQALFAHALKMPQEYVSLLLP